MKKVIKFFIIACVVGSVFIISKRATMGTSDKTYGDGIVRTIQFGGKNLYLGAGNSRNAIAYGKDGNSTQSFYFEYNQDRNAYKIYSAHNPNYILAWNANPYQDIASNVFYTRDGNLDEHYWVLEEALGSNKYYLRNYKQGNHGYLTAKSIQGGMNAIIGAKLNYENNYTEITISPNLRNDESIKNSKNKIWRILSGSAPNKSIHKDSPGVNVRVFNRYKTIDQRWVFEYSEEKEAYKIKNIDGKNVVSVLTWDSAKGNNVIAAPDRNSDDQYWRFEHIKNKNYVIKSYKNPKYVLETIYNKAWPYDIQVRLRRDSLAQWFQLAIYD